MDKLDVLFEVLDEGVLVFAHAKEVRFLLDLGERFAVIRIAVIVHLGLVFRDKRFLTHVVPTFVGVQVNVPVCSTTSPQRLGVDFVPFRRGSDVVVVADLRQCVQLLEATHVLIAHVYRLNALLGRRSGDFLAMLVRASQVKDIPTKHAVVPCNDVRRNSLVGMPDVSSPVRVVNCGGDVKLRQVDARRIIHIPTHSLIKVMYHGTRLRRGRRFRRCLRLGGIQRRPAHGRRQSFVCRGQGRHQRKEVGESDWCQRTRVCSNAFQ